MTCQTRSIMLPVIALIGRPNVGKSTLFNRLTRSRDALVADVPGLTRDRKYGLCQFELLPALLVDTGGLSGEEIGIDVEMARQSAMAADEADLVLFMVDARTGLLPHDQSIANWLRRLGKPVVVVLNKTDGLDPDLAAAEIYSLGLGTPLPVSASHGRGVQRLMEEVVALLPATVDETSDEAEPVAEEGRIRIAVIGRPNVGKSTLINRFLGEERVIAYDQPGTTRDTIRIPFERAGQRYLLLDTAGVRRRARVSETIEKFSIIKTLEAMREAHVVILLIDAREGVTEQDAGLIGLVIDSGRALVVGINKWDGLGEDQRSKVLREMELRLSFLDFARQWRISALHGSGVGELLDFAGEAYRSAMRKFPTPELTRLLEDAVATHPPPLAGGRAIKLRYAHQGSSNPPSIIIHGNRTDHVPESYRRYLSNTFRKQLKLFGTPLRIEFRSGENPYEGRKNRLTPRQVKRRQKMISHHKRREKR
jgi:GTP-binding protein